MCWETKTVSCIYCYVTSIIHAEAIVLVRPKVCKGASQLEGKFLLDQLENRKLLLTNLLTRCSSCPQGKSGQLEHLVKKLARVF